MKELRLHIGGKDTGITVTPAVRYPKMWRISWADGQVSPMGNLARAKEAAIRYVRQIPDFSGEGLVHRWKPPERPARTPRTAVSQAPVLECRI